MSASKQKKKKTDRWSWKGGNRYRWIDGWTDGQIDSHFGEFHRDTVMSSLNEAWFTPSMFGLVSFQVNKRNLDSKGVQLYFFCFVAGKQQ